MTADAREQAIEKGLLALMTSPEVPTGVRAQLLDESLTIRERTDAQPIVEAVIDALLALGWQPSRMVATVEELDALPVESVIRDAAASVRNEWPLLELRETTS